jgi:hypothetical protein
MKPLAGYDSVITTTINHSIDGAQTDYQLKLTIYKGAGVSAPGILYLANRSKNWPYDIRITSSDGTTILDTWREFYDASQIDLWIEIPSIPAATDPLIGVHVGNVSAADHNSGANTFKFFEDFNALTDGDINGQNGWVADATADVQTTYKYEGAKALQITGNGENKANHSITISTSHMQIQLCMMRTVMDNTNPYCQLYIQHGAEVITGIMLMSDIFHITPAGWLDTGGNAAASVWSKIRVAIDSQTTHLIWIDGVLMTPADVRNWNLADVIDTIILHHMNGASTYGYFDQLFVGNYTANEPTFNSFGTWQSTPKNSLLPKLQPIAL